MTKRPSIIHNGQVIFTLPPSSAPERDSVMYFTAPKSGTILLNKLLTSLLPSTGLYPVYLEGELFRSGISGEFSGGSPAIDAAPIFLPKGYCYGSPILPQSYTIPLLNKVKTILLVRDPRDMLVSLYYSVRESHPMPGKAAEVFAKERMAASHATIDAYVLQEAPRYRDLLRRYYDLFAQSPLVRIFRYEDIIYDKTRWVDDICDHYAWDIPEEQRNAAVQSVDIFPDKERTGEHIRQVHPGNYKQKLFPETISRLNEIVGAELTSFGYKS